MVLQHNLTAMFTNKQLGITTKSQAKSAEKLSTGYRINRAADDAAGLQISENMRRQIRGLNKASKNAEDGISYCQVADGAMGEIDNIIHRVKELCVQGANDTNTDADREAIQKEIDALSDEIGNITDNTQFNTLNVFGRDRELTITHSDGTIETMIKPVIGNNYGLGEILGEDEVSASSKMDSTFTLTGNWITTGEIGTTYNNDKRNELATMLGIPSLSLGDLWGNGYISYPNTSGVIDYPTTGTPTATITLSYVNIPAQGNVLLSASYYDKLTGKTIDYGSLATGRGSAPLENCDYDYAKLDFKSANDTPGYKVESLYNQGFSIGSAGDSGYCSIMFTNDLNDNPSSYSEGNSKLLKIDISDLAGGSAPETGKAIVERILSEVERNGLDNDYVQFAHNSDGTVTNSSTLYIIDNRGADYKEASFELISRGPNGEQVSDNTVTRYEVAADGTETTYTYKDKDLWIQSGDLELSGIMVKKEWLTRANIGLDRVCVADFESATASITICDMALEKVSSARSNLGAYMNRLEYAVAVDDNTSENVQSSESKLRDTDMADEMVEYSKSNILAQAGQSMLAQANQSTQGILSLLQ